MKYPIHYFVVLSVFLLSSCADGANDQLAQSEEKILTTLPMQPLNLNDLSGFKPVASNWQIVANVSVDENTNGAFTTEAGKGILVNTPIDGVKDHLFTAFEHGDIEIELDVMMPSQSNSGLYFQGRYEVQLFDSWGVVSPQYLDMGGIYQRWDETKENKGYEGFSPSINAALAPGLWQHFKIKFQAPKFDDEGKKIKNALFEEVWLNGNLLHQNQEVTGPTQSSAYQDEQPLAPLMIQGDHGAVAIRNISYKLYGGSKIDLQNVKLKEYVTDGNTSSRIPDVNALSIEREVTTFSISSKMATGENPRKLLVFNGNLDIPTSGDYLFEATVDGGGIVLLIDNDTIVNMNGDYFLNNPKLEIASLQKGTVPFTFIYNKHRPFRSGFGLWVEGPGMSKQAMHAPGSVDMNRLPANSRKVIIDVSDETVLQRGFLMHRGIKKTHGISVGTPEKVNYSFDLADGSLLQVWGGPFLDAAGMWVSRGNEQLAAPIGNAIPISKGPDFAFLRNAKADWPDSIPADDIYKQIGYELVNGNPKFSMQLNGSLVTNQFIASGEKRSLKRVISTNAKEEFYHKLGAGRSVEKQSGGTYAIDDKSYFVDFSGNDEYEPIIRRSEGKVELIVKIPAGKQEITYAIIW